MMIVLTLAGACALPQIATSSAASVAGRAYGGGDASVQLVNPVVQWNRTLLAIVRIPPAQPATIHPTRSFAIMHAAIYDAVNAINKRHTPYLVRVKTCRSFRPRTPRPQRPPMTCSPRSIHSS
jgi:hypothetical protein